MPELYCAEQRFPGSNIAKSLKMEASEDVRTLRPDQRSRSLNNFERRRAEPVGTTTEIANMMGNMHTLGPTGPSQKGQEVIMIQ
jgi:hypothetical protein